MAVIEVDNLVKDDPGTRAIDGVSFKVHKGEILGVLGPNGAGKTTTLRILTCVIPPTHGEATVDGASQSAPSLRGPPGPRVSG